MFRHILILQELIRRQHRNAVPRAHLMAKGAADAAGEINRADLHYAFMAVARDDADAIHRTDVHAGFAAGAHVFIQQGKNFGQLLLGHSFLL